MLWSRTSYFLCYLFSLLCSQSLPLNAIIKESYRSNSNYCDYSKTSQRLQLAEGGNIFISSTGSTEGSWESSEGWDEVMRGHVEQLSVTVKQRPPLRMESHETKGNKEMKHKHKPLWANSCNTSDLWPHSTVINRERICPNWCFKHHDVILAWSFMEILLSLALCAFFIVVFY